MPTMHPQLFGAFSLSEKTLLAAYLQVFLLIKLLKSIAKRQNTYWIYGFIVTFGAYG